MFVYLFIFALFLKFKLLSAGLFVTSLLVFLLRRFAVRRRVCLRVGPHWLLPWILGADTTRTV